MEKIAIIGSPGAGKTTLATKISSMLKIKVIHLDRLLWKRGWQGKSSDTRIDIMHAIAQEKHWVIEGTYINSSEARLDAADTIIFLDVSPFLCFWRIMKRHYVDHGRSRRDLPMECTDKLTLFRMLKVLFFPFREGRTLEQKLRNYNSKQVIRLHSMREVNDFLARQGQTVDGIGYVASEERSTNLGMESYPGLFASILQRFSSLGRA